MAADRHWLGDPQVKFDKTWEMAYASGYNAGKQQSAEKVKEAFGNLPPTADNATKDLLLDLYNAITEVPDITE